MSVEFLGNKNRLLDFIVPIIERTSSPKKRQVADLFCGTGSVSFALQSKGYSVQANDQLSFCTHFAMAKLLNPHAPGFKALKSEVQKSGQFKRQLTYHLVIDYLNSLRPIEGFIYHNYSPASKRTSGFSRMYFTEHNAGKIDAIRAKLSEWKNIIPEREWSLLLTNLLFAVSNVSNTAGTYGCYLKNWKKKALDQLELHAGTFEGVKTNCQVTCADANVLARNIKSHVVYADPPYTKRQYAAYYHILETIALADKPTLVGSTGLRPWLDQKSDYCYKRKAPDALKDLLDNLTFDHFYLSYNEDGQIPHPELLELLKHYGTVSVYEQKYPRYKSSDLPHKGPLLKERLYHLSR